MDNNNVLDYMIKRLNYVLKEKNILTNRSNDTGIEMSKLEKDIEVLTSGIDVGQEVFSPFHKKSGDREEELKKLRLKKRDLEETIQSLKKEMKHLNNEEFELKYYISELKMKQPDMTQEEHSPSEENYGIKILEQQENERQRIAREIHDSTVQVLTNLVHKTELCMRVMDSDPIRAKLELEIINNTIRYTINDMRNIIHNLRPMAFDDFGLEIALQRIVNQIKGSTEIEIHLEIAGDKIDVSPVTALTLVRIIQEACNNSIKHSKAKNIYIEFLYMVDYIQLSVQDDGVGFQVEESPMESDNDESGLGISIMKERTMLLSGEFNLSSEINKGTRVLVIVPLK